MPEPLDLPDIAAELTRIRARLGADDFTAEAGEALRTELRELVVTCRVALGRAGLLFRYSGFLRLADLECLRHSDCLSTGDVRGAWAALVKACDYLEQGTGRALRERPGAAARSAVARVA